MRTREADEGDEPARSTPAPAQRDAPSLAAAVSAVGNGLAGSNQILALQRMVGNATVLRLLEAEPERLQRAVTIGKDTYDTDGSIKADAVKPIPLASQGRKTEIVAKLNEWAGDKKHVDEEFKNMGLAVKAAIAALPELGESDEDEAKAPVVTPANYNGTDVFFNGDGMFCDESGDKLSALAVNSLAGKLGWTHIYTGHGPRVTERALRTQAMGKGVSGKWLTDQVVLTVVLEALRLVATGVINPTEPHFKVFDIASGTSMNFRKKKPPRTEGKQKKAPKVREEDALVSLDAIQAKVGFKKHVIPGEDVPHYVLKTVFPFPPRLPDTVDVEDDAL